MPCGFVYFMFCNICFDFYIGSCSKSIKQRFSSHIRYSTYFGRRNSKLYRHKHAINAKNFTIFKLKKVDYCHIDELRMFEAEYYDMLRPTLNTKRPYLTEDERKDLNTDNTRNYRNLNKDKCRKNCREYKKKNAEAIKNYNKAYKANNAEKIRKQEKIYWEKNPEKFKQKKQRAAIKNKERKRLYRLKNKEEIKNKLLVTQ